MKMSRLVCLIYLVIQITVLPVFSQSMFSQGVIIYKIDTLNRINSNPSNYMPSQIKVFIKDSLVRFEYTRVNKFNPDDFQRIVEIRGKNGVYSFIDSKAVKISFALFMTYEEEKVEKANISLENKLPDYTIEKNLEDTTWLQIPSKKVLLKMGTNHTEAVLTNSLNIPLHLFFSTLRNLESSPLQFIESDENWRFQVSAISIQKQSILDQLFEVDKNVKVMSLEEAKKFK